jgi:tripartite-type tricarboxylate transporter receptor subunit TctC
MFFLIAFSLATPAFAERYPDKPITLVVGFAPGGGTDVVARVIAEKLTEYLGQTVIVENRAGATGTLAAAYVAKSKPDGYTLLVSQVGPNAIAPNLLKKIPYNAAKDFESIIYLGYVPNVLTIYPGIPVNSVPELIALAKSKPGELTFASSGYGSTQHIAGEMFQMLTNTKMLHVPYKGSGQAVIDLLAGTVTLNFDTLPPVLSSIKQGKLKALAVSTPERLPQLPNVPTFKEVGITGFDVTNWYGIEAPAHTPKEIVNLLNFEINKALKDPTVRERLDAVGTMIGGGTPQEFDSFIEAEIKKYAKLVKDAKLQAQ